MASQDEGQAPLSSLSAPSPEAMNPQPPLSSTPSGPLPLFKMTEEEAAEHERGSLVLKFGAIPAEQHLAASREGSPSPSSAGSGEEDEGGVRSGRRGRCQGGFEHQHVLDISSMSTTSQRRTLQDNITQIPDVPVDSGSLQNPEMLSNSLSFDSLSRKMSSSDGNVDSNTLHRETSVWNEGDDNDPVFLEIFARKLLDKVLSKVHRRVMKEVRVVRQAALSLERYLSRSNARTYYVQRVHQSIHLAAFMRRGLCLGYRERVMHMRQAAKLLQGVVRGREHRREYGGRRDHSLSLQGVIRRRLATFETFPLIREGRNARFLSAVVGMRFQRQTYVGRFSVTCWLQQRMRSSSERRRYCRVKPAVRLLQAKVRRLIFEYIQMVAHRAVKEILDTALEGTFAEIELRRNPTALVAQGPEGEVQVLGTMRGWMAAMGRSMARYISPATSKPSTPYYLRERLKPESGWPREGKKGSFRFNRKFLPEVLPKSWSAGRGEGVAKRKEEAMVVNLERSLEARELRNKVLNTSRLDPFFRAGNGAPLFGRGGPSLLPRSPPREGEPTKSKEEREMDRKRRELLRKNPDIGGGKLLSELSEEEIGVVDECLDAGWSSKKDEKRWVAWGKGGLTFEEISQTPDSWEAKYQKTVEKAAKLKAAKQKQAAEAKAKEEARDSEAKALFDLIDSDGSGVLAVDEIERYLDQMGYGDDEIQDFISEVDTDYSGSVSWEEFKPVAGRFIDQDEVGRDHQKPPTPPPPKQPTTAKPKPPPPKPQQQQLPEISSPVPPKKQHAPAPPPPKIKFVDKWVAPDDEDDLVGGRGDYTKFWAKQIGNRQAHQVDFSEVNADSDPAQTAFLRTLLSNRFNNVAEAFVFFDLDTKGVISAVKLEAGLFRMGVSSVFNPNQLLVELSANGVISLLSFCRRLHWGYESLDEELDDLYLQARIHRQTVLQMGLPPPDLEPKPRRHRTPAPRHPKTAPAGARREGVGAGRKLKVMQLSEQSSALHTISLKYGGGWAESVKQQGKGVGGKPWCNLTVQSARDAQKSEERGLGVDMPETPPRPETGGYALNLPEAVRVGTADSVVGGRLRRLIGL